MGLTGSNVNEPVEDKMATCWGQLPPPSQGGRMPQRVVHFEVIGKDPTRLREYFGELFGWEFDVPSPVTQEVSEPANDGFLVCRTVNSRDKL